MSTARRAGLRANLQLYRPILLLLAVAAVYEAIEVIGMVALARIATGRLNLLSGKRVCWAQR
jgi:hypothetical protein